MFDMATVSTTLVWGCQTVVVRYQEPEFLPWDGRRVPMTFVAGYLGAGKTTLLNELLARTDRPIAVLVNDVGEVNIDARLLKKRSADTIELTDGCVCCSINEGFGFALDQLRDREEPPDHVVVELSGVAEPDRVLPWANSAGFVLDGVITLVDVDQFAARMATPTSAHAIERQLAAADAVLLTKLDLSTDENRGKVQECVEAMIGSDVPVLQAPTIDSMVGLLQLGGRRPGGVVDLPTSTLFDRHRTELWPLPQPATEDELLATLDRLPSTVVRAKGIAGGGSGERWSIQVVGGRRSIEPLPPAERQEPTDLVVISYP